MTDHPVSLTQAPAGYADWLADLKSHIHSAQQRATSIDKPIGVAEYDLMRHVPERLANTLPSIEEIEQELADLPDEASERED